MPVVAVGRDKLFEALGRSYEQEDFEHLCFQYGVELDDVTSEAEMLRKEHGGREGPRQGGASEEVLYKIDIPANRYDMLSLEGIARALNIFLRRIAPVQYTLADPGPQRQRLVVRPETALVRPFVVAAVLRGVRLDPARFASFIDLQDKLHHTLCRQRSLVAIGTHDLGTVKGPFSYEALPPEEIEFVPLKQTRKFTARALLEHYLEHDLKLRKYVPHIHALPVWPVILDADRRVMSLPPIINSAHSQITLDTRDIFIECTATDLTKAKVVLNTVCALFSEYAAVPFQTEPVEVVDGLREPQVYPDLSARRLAVDVQYINTCVGTRLGAAEMAEGLSRMGLEATAEEGGQAISVQVPPTRSDVLHPCDVAEDVAIAYGYNNLAVHAPQTVVVGSEQPINALTELVRLECALAGWTEILTWALCSQQESFAALRQSPTAADGRPAAVQVSNPATAEFEVCRTSLLNGALKTLASNKDTPLPLRLFEASDVVLRDAAADVGARNERRLVAVYCGKEHCFEIIHGLLNRLMDVLGVPLTGDFGQDAAGRQKELYGGGYCWQPSSSPTFFPGRQAQVLARDTPVGTFGLIHPEVLASFDIAYTVAALELNLEPFCYSHLYRPLPTHLSLAGHEE